jgi:hypothetical protein
VNAVENVCDAVVVDPDAVPLDVYAPAFVIHPDASNLASPYPLALANPGNLNADELVTENHCVGDAPPE